MAISIIDICNMALSMIAQPQITGIDENSEAARHCRLHLELDRDSVMSSFTWTFATAAERLVRVIMEPPEAQPLSQPEAQPLSQPEAQPLSQPKAQPLSQLVPGYQFAYRKPSDCLRIIRLIDPSASLSKVNAAAAEQERYREFVTTPAHNLSMTYGDAYNGKPREAGHYRPEAPVALILSNISGALIEYIRRVVDPTLWDPLFREALVLKLALSLSGSITGSGQRTAEFNALYEQALARAKLVNANNDSSSPRLPTTLRDSRR